jgi:class 3 adenylate cyclase
MNPHELNRHIEVYAELTGKTRQQVIGDAIMAAFDSNPTLMNPALAIVACGMQKLVRVPAGEVA